MYRVVKVTKDGTEVAKTNDTSSEFVRASMYKVTLSDGQIVNIAASLTQGPSIKFDIPASETDRIIKHIEAQHEANKGNASDSEYNLVCPVDEFFDVRNTSESSAGTTVQLQKDGKHVYNVNWGLKYAGRQIDTELLINASTVYWKGKSSSYPVNEVMNYLITNMKITGQTVSVPAIPIKYFGQRTESDGKFNLDTLVRTVNQLPA